MYDWLPDALRDAGQVVTANQRLARVLAADFGRQQIAAGRLAWRSPAIRSWQVWLLELLASAEPQQRLPGRINAQQSQVLWERCLGREISDPLLNLALLVRQARDAWARLHEFCVPLSECEGAASGMDQRIFAKAAKSYRSILDREHWVDDACLAGQVTNLIASGQARMPGSVTLAGFDRMVPQAATLVAALRQAGVRVTESPESHPAPAAAIHSYENSASELRAAGGWARAELEKSPTQNIAIVAPNLERDAERCTRLIREGLAPGWQTSDEDHKASLDVSYGKKLTDYPAISAALLALRWLRSDLTSQDVGSLLRSAAIGHPDMGGRARLDLVLRQQPNRNWSPAMVLGLLSDCDDTDAARDWLERVAVLDSLRGELPRREAPSKWVVLIDDALKRLNWPGSASLDSVEFQLINRWRNLLNDLARLELVAATMSFAEVSGRLLTMAGEAVFQPEGDAPLVQLLGPLEAAGLNFERLWISGLSAANWPPAGKPSPLISRSLQRDYGMPDATPDDTLDYARRVMQRLAASADQLVCSYPLTEGDIEQSESGLLTEIATQASTDPQDPGWYARSLVSLATPVAVDNDHVPLVASDETLSGGAATIHRQLVEPFSAFVFGRLGVRPVATITDGLAAGLRGSLIHDALHQLYADLPLQTDIRSWTEASLLQRVDAAAKIAFRRQERYADLVLRQLLGLERRRVASLLRSVVAMDLTRQGFSVAAVEKSVETEISGIQVRLRIDRIDELDSGGLVILDYKTGMRKPFLDNNGDLRDTQLAVYARALGDPVAGLGLVNIDSRGVAIDAAGCAFTPDLDWDDTLSRWRSQVDDAATAIRCGDVRINMQTGVQASRPLSLLSRIRELQRDA
jgi:probable DNA repair protein